MHAYTHASTHACMYTVIHAQSCFGIHGGLILGPLRDAKDAQLLESALKEMIAFVEYLHTSSYKV